MLSPASRGFFLALLFMAFVKLFVWLVNRVYLTDDYATDSRASEIPSEMLKAMLERKLCSQGYLNITFVPDTEL